MFDTIDAFNPELIVMNSGIFFSKERRDKSSSMLRKAEPRAGQWPATTTCTHLGGCSCRQQRRSYHRQLCEGCPVHCSTAAQVLTLLAGLHTSYDTWWRLIRPRHLPWPTALCVRRLNSEYNIWSDQWPASSIRNPLWWSARLSILCTVPGYGTGIQNTSPDPASRLNAT